MTNSDRASKYYQISISIECALDNLVAAVEDSVDLRDFKLSSDLNRICAELVGKRSIAALAMQRERDEIEAEKFDAKFNPKPGIQHGPEFG